MTQVKTFDRIGVAEDVSNIITNIDPYGTPFQTMISKGSVHQPFYQWQEDDLRSVRDNAAVEGADAVTATRAPTRMRANYTQIVQESFQISDRVEKTKYYGRASEVAYQSAKLAKELKRDLEWALVGTARNASAGNSSTASRMGNVLGQDASSTPVNTVLNRFAPSVTNGVFTENLLLTAHQALYNEGADVNTLMINPHEALYIANFTASAGRERDFGSSKKVVNVVDVYVSPFGEVKVVMNRFIQGYIADDAPVVGEQVDPTPSDDGDSAPDQLSAALLFDPNMFELCTFRAWKRTKLAKTGDADKWQMLGEYGLKHKNGKASAVFTGLGEATS